jgi:hypothetical protein
VPIAHDTDGQAPTLEAAHWLAPTFARVSPRSAARFKSIYSFTGKPDGEQPESPVIDVNGTLYGTTYSGGTARPANASYFRHGGVKAAGRIASIERTGFVNA